MKKAIADRDKIVQKTKDFKNLYDNRKVEYEDILRKVNQPPIDSKEMIEELFRDFDRDMTLSLTNFIRLENYMADFLHNSFWQKSRVEIVKNQDVEIERMKLSYTTKEEADEVFSLIDKSRMQNKREVMIDAIDSLLRMQEEESTLYRDRSGLRSLYYSLDSKTRELFQEKWKNILIGFSTLEKERVNSGHNETYSLLKTVLVRNMKSFLVSIEIARKEYIKIDIDDDDG